MGIMPDRFNSTSSPFQVPPVNTYPASVAPVAVVPDVRGRVTKALSPGVLLAYKLGEWTDEELIAHVAMVVNGG
jgi:hypothetical protein